MATQGTLAGTDPVAAALREASAITGRVEVRVSGATEPGWVAYRDVLRPERASDLVDLAAALCGGCQSAVARTAAASLMVGDVASALATPIASALVAHRRAVSFDPADVSLRFNAGGVDGIAVSAPHVGVLPGDQLAGQPNTTTVDDIDALRRSAAEGYVRLLTPALVVVRNATRRGWRALWTDAADRLASAVFLTLQALDAPQRAPAEVADLLAVAPPELRHQVQWVDIPLSDGWVPWKRRAVCCLAYQTPRWADQYCATCPLVSPEETVRRVQPHGRGEDDGLPDPGTRS
jgi:hypothetical protein